MADYSDGLSHIVHAFTCDGVYGDMILQFYMICHSEVPGLLEYLLSKLIMCLNMFTLHDMHVGRASDL